MVDNQAFIQAILANPTDDSPRLVYADWLEERGDSRGEFLRIQTALTRMPKKDKRYARFRKRLKELRSTLDSETLSWYNILRCGSAFPVSWREGQPLPKVSLPRSWRWDRQ